MDMGLLKFIITLLEPIANLFNKYGILKALGYIAIIVFGVIILYSGYVVITLDKRIDRGIDKVLTEQTDAKEEAHEKGVEKRFANMDAINCELRDIMQKAGADRACVLEMHNGTNNTAGLPFIYCEMTYEQVGDGIQHVDDEYARINLTRYAFPYYLMYHKYYCGSIQEAMGIDDKIATKMSHDGTGYILVYQIISGDKLIGYFALTWNNSDEVNITTDKMAQITMAASNLGKMLD